ncbi:unnamed protein product [Schistocephalus solidus]|uniref:Reverse transcriptase domain-containing protein n=1 Tax=Schistocephalus solidus TaxID=70667 RepID=A0A3P7E8B0_SCHSO|nr:unnamed protein product [Schistocephalus solidus]
MHEEDAVDLAPGRRLADLDYADDIALIASNFGDLQSMMSRVNEVAKSAGLSINTGKTKFFSSCIPAQEKAPLVVNDRSLDEVESFKYLGIRVYRASVRSVLLYGCECWATRVKDDRKLETFVHDCLRTILRVKYTDFVSNETVRTRFENIARIPEAIQERRLRWFGHVLCRPSFEISHTALDRLYYPIGGFDELVSSKTGSTYFLKTWKMFVDLGYSASVVGEENGLSCPGLLSRIVMPGGEYS